MAEIAPANDEPLIPLAELEPRLTAKLERIDWRATSALVIAPACLGKGAEEVRGRVEESLGLRPEEVVRWVADAGGATDERLATLNQARDELLKERRLIWLRVSSPEEVRRVRRIAPDLTAAVDLLVELRADEVETAE